MLKFVLLFFSLSFSVFAGHKDVQLPVLNWIKCSDWYSVKDYGAQGDGKTDDTAAIQKLYNLASSGKVKNIYFPPGKYRITKTLVLSNQKGLYVVGHGRDTVLFWDGEKGGSIYRSNGIHRSRYEGITYDGRGIAGICCEHCSQTRYETSITYKNCAFMNADIGIATSRHQRKVASAEIYYENLIFKNTKTGLLLNEYNDYDHILEGCVFINNEIGIHSYKGHFNIRNSHFIGSKIVDIRVSKPQHPGSVRWCTSDGSKMFFETGGKAPAGEGKGMAEDCNWMQPYTIQGCYIRNWKNKNGAILLRQLGPTLLFDNFFSNNREATVPVAMMHNKGTAILTSSNNLLNGKKFAVKSLGKLEQVEIPATSNSPKPGGTMPWFFKSKVKVPQKVFDAKIDFGAKGNGREDDTDAVIKTIAAARKYGQGAIAYFPVGNYRITRQLVVNGSNYGIGGSGKCSVLQWYGDIKTPIIHVSDPQNIKISNLAIWSIYEGRKTPRKRVKGKIQDLNSFFKDKTEAEKSTERRGALKILQTGTGPSSISYDNLYAFNVYSYAPGIEL